MTSVVLIIVAVIAVVVLLAGILALALDYAFEEPPRADEIHTIGTSDGWHIRLCRYTATSGEGEPVLVVHGLCGNQFNLTIPDAHSLVDYLSRHGFDCWAIDLRGCRSSRGPAGVSRRKANLEDAVNHDIPAAIDHIRAATGAGRVHWVGHSLGGLIYYAYEQIHGPDALLSACTLGTPARLQSASMPGANLLRSVGIPSVRFVPGLIEFQMRLFAPLIRPLRYESISFPINWENTHPALRSADLYNVIELPPYRFFQTLLDWTEQGAWHVRNGEIDVQAGLPDLKTPLLSIYGAADPLAPASVGEQFVQSLKQKDKGLLVLGEANGYSADYNHIDLAFAVNGEREVFEPIRQWLAEHSVHAVPQPAASSPAARLLADTEDTSWRKALRRAAAVINEADGERSPEVASANPGPGARPSRRKPAANSKKAKPKKKKAAAKGKKKPTAKQKTLAKEKAAAKKKTAAKSKKKAAAKKKAKAKSKAKKPAAKKKTVSKSTAKKPAAKKKTVTKSTAKKKKAAKKKR